MMVVYGHNQTRPGIEPPEWYGVVQWHADRKAAVLDMQRAAGLPHQLWACLGQRPPLSCLCLHRIEEKQVPL